jgi:DNA-binding NarL/FixJ family response regulator
MIRVVLVDDQTLVRAGLRALLGLLPDIEVTAELDGGEAALEQVPALAPDVLLLDLRMPGIDGLGVLEGLRRRGKQPPTLILTTFDDDASFLAAVRAGARGFLLKDTSLERLAEAIRVVAAGGTHHQPALTERVLRAALEAGFDFPAMEEPVELTDRERDVLRLMTAGFSNREIAEALFMAEGTVKNHISVVLSKLGVRDRTRAVLKALEGRLV